MKTTEFLKKYSLIDETFIDDFYSFYDENKNEYDFTIDLDKIAVWLEVNKGHLKRLLESNFVKDQDYVITKPLTKRKGTGTNNIQIVMLTYTCAKLLCMISKCKKATIIRNYYVELEKLLIKYKDDIVENLNRQIGIKNNNKKIINANKNVGLIYILKVDEETYKIGKTIDIKKRMQAYNVGRVSELPIAFVYRADNINEIEQCIKDNLRSHQAKNKTELFKVNLDFIKETVRYCSIKSTPLLTSKKQFLGKNANKNWQIIIDKENTLDISDLIGKPRKASKQLSRKNSKTVNTKHTRKSNKQISRKISKKVSRKSSRKIARKPLKKPSRKSVRRQSRK
jgi:phage anti-repressor protein